MSHQPVRDEPVAKVLADVVRRELQSISLTMDVDAGAMMSLTALEKLALGGSGVAARIDAAEKAILAAADALRDKEPNEAYHQLYRYADPTFTERGDPFEKLRARVSAGGGTEDTTL